MPGCRCADTGLLAPLGDRGTSSSMSKGRISLTLWGIRVGNSWPPGRTALLRGLTVDLDAPAAPDAPDHGGRGQEGRSSTCNVGPTLHVASERR